MEYISYYVQLEYDSPILHLVSENFCILIEECGGPCVDGNDNMSVANASIQNKSIA